jgi:hypothetical protein
VEVDVEEDEERVVSSSYGDEEKIVSSSWADDDAGRGEVRGGDEIVEVGDEDAEVRGEEWMEEEIVPGSESPEQRRVKRRRLSLDDEGMSSSMPIQPRVPPSDQDSALEQDEELEAQEGKDVSSTWLGSEDEDEDMDLPARDVAALQQPTFRPAPRFKPTEGDASTEGLLPAAFSPQRRGAKYVPGGLAAELQGWLSDVKRWDEDIGALTHQSGREGFKILVKEVSRDGGRMYLVRGSVEAGGGEDGRFILAGEGRLTGLGRRKGGDEVRVGGLVEVEGPVWEVELEDRIWVVCCEWWVG